MESVSITSCFNFSFSLKLKKLNMEKRRVLFYHFQYLEFTLLICSFTKNGLPSRCQVYYCKIYGMSPRYVYRKADDIIYR